MKNKALFAVLAILLAAAAFAENETVTMKGEIVDLHCYTSRGEKGEGHAGCANACISRDVPAGFIAEDGTLYLLVNEKPVSVKEKVAGKAGKPVQVTGKVVERSGMKALQLTSVE
ncbi:MAG TPA: hypothetical protein VHW00_02645 [Thermoanaerobaculia bacterium]|nr:hypothetical protein [Thermoanaerobaculia bacterium]